MDAVKAFHGIISANTGEETNDKRFGIRPGVGLSSRVSQSDHQQQIIKGPEMGPF
jgi:hypothetical protein